MTSIDPIVAMPGPTTDNGPQDHAMISRTKAQTDFDTFLRLLTAQLRHQDPMAPADPTQFVAQLATFSQVEQALLTNRHLGEVLSSLRASEMMTSIAFIGRSVEAAVDRVRLSDGDASFSYILDSQAKRVSVTIKDESGQVVRTMSGDTTAGRHDVTWNGLRDDGTFAPAGTYHIEVTAQDERQKPIDTTIVAADRVKSVVVDMDGPVLVLENGVRIAPTEILSAT